MRQCLFVTSHLNNLITAGIQCPDALKDVGLQQVLDDVLLDSCCQRAIICRTRELVPKTSQALAISSRLLVRRFWIESDMLAAWALEHAPNFSVCCL